MSGPRHPSTRVPPTVEGPSGRIAEELRQQAQLDDVTRARMERAMLEAWRTRASAHVPLPESRSRARRERRAARNVWMMASLAASAAAGALLGLFAFDSERAVQVPAGVAQFELRIGDAAVQSGGIAEGQMLESGKHGHIEVALRDARVDLARDTRLRFDRISAKELALSLSRGRVDVDFHPARKGEQRMSITSRAARVLVVGTRFSVEVDSLGNTHVVVTEGVVEVWPRSGAPSKRVSSGQSLHVRVDDGDEHERAVRDAIESQLAEAQAPVEAAVRAEPDMDLTDMVDEPQKRVRPSRVAIERQLGELRALLRHGRHAEARQQLSTLAAGPIGPAHKLEALTLIAESYTAQGYVPRARKTYERAVAVAPAHPAALNAQFALARLLERYANDRPAAVSAYERYLKRAPSGALAPQAREALCRLGQAEHCL
ncbi:MAG: FecR family protein [Myxococcales bacterium]|nr:FecR family protein [Myxococcales bacterium]